MRLTSVRIEDTTVATRDGTLLATDVILAEGGGPRPALLLRTPYGRAGVRQVYDVAALARAGWALVAQDVRGRGDSAGNFDPFRQERSDGRDAVDWCAAQPWCDGRVAMTGGSYLGLTQLHAAAAAPAALRAISPSVAPSDVKEGWHWNGGVFGTGLALSWGSQMAATLPRATARQRARAAELAADWRRSFATPRDRHPLRDLLPAFRSWADPADQSYWRPLNLAGQYRRMDVAAFHVGGWYDVFCEGTIRNWQGMSTDSASEYARRSQRLIVGPWSHAGTLFQMSPEMDFGPAASGLAIPAETLQWLRDALEGKPVEGGVRVFVLGRGGWIDLTGWPPPARPTALFLDADGDSRRTGTLGLEPATTHRVTRWLHDPDDPVPTMGGRTLGPWLPLPGPVDQRRVEGRDDVLVFTGPTLSEETTVVGEVTADLVVGTDAEAIDVVVKLVDVHPDGRAFNVLEAVRRVAGRTGRPRSIQVSLGSIAIAFQPGHRIRVHVTSSSYPRFEVDRGSGATLHSLHTGGRARSRITLPLFNG